MGLVLNDSLYNHHIRTLSTKALIAGAATLLSPERKEERSTSMAIINMHIQIYTYIYAVS